MLLTVQQFKCPKTLQKLNFFFKPYPHKISNPIIFQGFPSNKLAFRESFQKHFESYLVLTLTSSSFMNIKFHLPKNFLPSPSYTIFINRKLKPIRFRNEKKKHRLQLQSSRTPSIIVRCCYGYHSVALGFLLYSTSFFVSKNLRRKAKDLSLCHSNGMKSWTLMMKNKKVK